MGCSRWWKKHTNWEGTGWKGLDWKNMAPPDPIENPSVTVLGEARLCPGGALDAQQPYLCHSNPIAAQDWASLLGFLSFNCP